MKSTQFTNKTIKTETKVINIVRETNYCVYVRPADVDLYKDIAVGKSDLVRLDDGNYELLFNKAVTYTPFQLFALGFNNAKQRKQQWLNQLCKS